MKKYLDFVREFHENNESGIAFVSNQLKKHLLENTENQTEIETILDFLYANQKTDISKIGYATILAKTEKWHKKLQSVTIKNDDTEGIDYEVAKDFGDGFRFVKLISKSSYEREGKLMSHCVASYFGRDTEIYSLRDPKNAPHCTIENGAQIKGKGNGKIDPKYVDYVVKFLEHLGMTVRENEMKNLGYYKLESIDNGLTCENTYNGYVYENNLFTIKDSEGDAYNGLGIFNVKSMFEFDMDLNFKFAFNFTEIVNFFVKKIHSEGINSTKNASSRDNAKNASSGDYAKNASSGYNAKNASSGDYAQNASSGDYAQNASSGYNAKNASSGYNAKNASSGDNAKNASSGDNAKNASSGDYAQNASSGDYAQNASSGYSAKNASSGYSAKNASSGDSAKNASSGDYAKNASSGDSAKNASSGYYAVNADIGKGSMTKAKIGSWIVLAEYDHKKNPIAVVAKQVDGKEILEDTWYTLKDGVFTVTKP